MYVRIFVCRCNKLHELLDLAQMELGEASLMDATIIAPVIVWGGKQNETLHSWCLQEEHCLLILALFNFSSHFFFFLFCQNEK